MARMSRSGDWLSAALQDPLLDVALFRDPRFTAASAAITIAFALFGFIFLITQYFQFLRGYSAFESGLRVTPVALCVAIGSVLGTLLVTRVGNTVVVTTGLFCSPWPTAGSRRPARRLPTPRSPARWCCSASAWA